MLTLRGAMLSQGAETQGEGQLKSPMPTENEQSGAKAATTPPAVPEQEVTNRDVQWSIEPGNGTPDHLSQTMLVRGEIESKSDLTVEGRVEGPINLGTNSLTIGRTGQVNGDIQARSVTILGEVAGNIVASEKVEITDMGQLVGDICAPRISVSEGAHFKGSVDMASPAKVRKQ